MLPKIPGDPFPASLSKRFSSKADENAFWAGLEKEREQHDPALAFSRFHTERIAGGRDLSTHHALIDAIRQLTRTLESPSVKTVTSQLPSGHSVSMTIHEMRAGAKGQ